MSNQPVDPTSPVVAYACAASRRLAEVASRPVWSMTPSEHRTALVALAELATQIEALRLRVLAEADRTGATDGQGAGSAADWVAGENRQTRRTARADLRLARAVEQTPALEAAMGSGTVNAEQARAIVFALAHLPSTGEFAVTAEQRGDAEAFLIAHAAHHDADDLRRLGRRLFEVIAPDLADTYEGRLLEVAEARALRQTSLSMWEDEHGVCHGRFAVPHLHGQILGKAVFALDSAQDADEPVDVRRGLAFTRLLESLRDDDLPATGGTGATVIVTMTLEQLLDGLGACGLDTGGTISASEARRLACTAGIIPAVLGGRSQLLDLGRRRRFHTQPQRIALAHRDGGCTAVGCDKPPGMCHAHHDVAWSTGGGTSVANGRLLCGHHHRQLHDPTHDHRIAPNNRVEFNRRT